MIRSRFKKTRTPVRGGSSVLTPIPVYKIDGPLNTYTSNEMLPRDHTPYARNFRNDISDGVNTRKGPGKFSDMIGLSSIASAAPQDYNYVLNPNLEYAITNWASINGANTTISRDTVNPYAGVASLKAVRLNAVSDGCYATTDGLTSGTTYTASAYVFIPTGTTLTFSFRNTANTLTYGSTTIAGNNTWQRVSVSGLCTSTVGGRIYFMWATTATVQIDNVQLEHNATLSSYFDGDSLDTASTVYYWEGATGATKSHREMGQPVGGVYTAAEKFTPTTSGRLFKAEMAVRDEVSNPGTGPILVKVCIDNGGVPGTVIATSSIANGTLSTAYFTTPCYFIDAPPLTAGTYYWLVLEMQDDGTNQYYWSYGGAGGTGRISNNNGANYTTPGGGFNYSISVGTDAPVKGVERYNYSGVGRYLMAHGTSLYEIADGTGVATSIKTGLSSLATRYKFARDTDNKKWLVNGQDVPQTVSGSVVSIAGGSPPISNLVLRWKNRMFFVPTADPTKIIWSNIGAYTTFSANDFAYVPSPLTNDPIKAWVITSNDELLLITRNTKYLLSGSGLSDFYLREIAGSQGAVNGDCVQTDGNYVYGVSPDQIWRWNGLQDEPLQELIPEDFKGIANLTSITTGLWDNKFFIYFAETGSSYSNAALVFNTLNKNMYYDTGLPIGVTATTEDKNEMVVASNLGGFIMKADKAYSDMGKPIDFEWRSKYETVGLPTNKKRFRRWYPVFKAADTSFNVQCQYDRDFRDNPSTTLFDVGGTGARWGGFNWGDGTRWGRSDVTHAKITLPGAAEGLQYRIKRYGVDNPVQFIGWTTLYRMKRLH